MAEKAARRDYRQRDDNPGRLCKDIFWLEKPGIGDGGEFPLNALENDHSEQIPAPRAVSVAGGSWSG